MYSMLLLVKIQQDVFCPLPDQARLEQVHSKKMYAKLQRNVRFINPLPTNVENMMKSYKCQQF
jgi:hypothetical protein